MSESYSAPISETLLGIMNGTIKSTGVMEPVSEEKRKSRKEIFDALFPMPERMNRRTGNRGALDDFTLKLERDYSKLVSKEPSEGVQHFIDKYSSDSELYQNNGKGLEKRAKFYVGGIVTGALGLFVLIPALGGRTPPVGIDIFSKAAMGAGGLTLGAGVIDVLNSLRIESFSYAADFLERIYDSYKAKKEQMKDIFSFLDAYKKNPEDKTLEFARRILPSIDLNKNSWKVNYLILSGMANYRKAELQKSIGEASDEDVEKAYGQMILCFEEAMNNKKCSDSFRNDSRINALIDDFCARQQEMLGRGSAPQKC